MKTNVENEKVENVVSIFGSRTNKVDESSASQADQDSSFEAEVKRNKEVAEKLRLERQKANQAVLRSYRLKT